MTYSPLIDRLLNSPRPWLTDGGLETSLIFHEGVDLPHFAAFGLVDDDSGRQRLRTYFDRYIGLARDAGTGFVLDTPTWRAGAAWADTLRTDVGSLADANRRAVAFADELRAANADVDIAIEGVVGPADDGYAPETMLAPDEAQEIHAPQIRALAEAGVDMASAITMTHPGEAIGIVRAARAAGLPAVVSFTTETDGNLPNGQSLRDAIAEVEDATARAPIYYMVNCAHPDHFSGVLKSGAWLKRIGGVRANASRMSHAELDAAETLDDGDPEEFGSLYAGLWLLLPDLRVVGGCCGTDHRHVHCVAKSLLQPVAA